MDELAALLDGMRTSLKIADEHFELSVALLRDDLTPRMEHLKIQRDLEELRSAILQTESTLIRHRAALAEAKEKEREIVLDFQRLATEDVAETEVQIASKQEILTAVQDQERRAEIRAPIDGFVQNMRHHTLGGVIQPGEPIMDLVPVDNNLLVEARVDPRDIGHIEKGMKATVKFSTYDFMRYGGLEGEVINVAADANTDPTREALLSDLCRNKRDRTWCGARSPPYSWHACYCRHSHRYQKSSRLLDRTGDQITS